MNLKKQIHRVLVVIVFLFSFTICNAQDRPSLFFREDWQEISAATPVNQQHVVNKDLILGLYGPGRDSIRKSHHVDPLDDPYYVWSGLCMGNWVVTLKKAKAYVDLTGQAKIIWRSKQSGLRCLHLVIKLADGSWLVGDQCDDRSQDWRIREFNIMDINWYKLSIKPVTEGNQVSNVNLSKVDEIGFTDLMAGGGSDACSRLDWIEVYGKSIDR
ncbi:MAG: hypothetical protein ABI416_18470 [Ginsengibacter sp.]